MEWILRPIGRYVMRCAAFFGLPVGGGGEFLPGKITRSLRDYASIAPEAARETIEDFAARLADIGSEDRDDTSLNDALTGTYNQLYFERLVAELNREGGVASRRPSGRHYVVTVDLSGLDRVGLDCGPDARDAVIRHAGHRLSALVRESDVVCRIGPCEFAIVLRHASPEGARDKTAAIGRALAAEACRWKGIEIGIHASLCYGEIRPRSLAREVRKCAHASQFIMHKSNAESAGARQHALRLAS